MIRRDYILRMIEEFAAALRRMRSLKTEERWDEVADDLDAEFTKLVGQGADGVARLSEMELLAQLMKEGPTHVLRHKTLLLTTLLAEAGDVAAGQGRTEESRECYLKSLHLLLEAGADGDALEYPEFVPKVEFLWELLRAEVLPQRTLALLMQHYERLGEFGKAEDALHLMVEADPGNRPLGEFGLAFYRSLLGYGEAALAAGNLPRLEVEQGYQELQTRLQSAAGVAPGGMR